MNFSSLVRHHARYTPLKPVFITDRVWTYVEFDQRVDALARALLASGLAPGDAVAAIMKNSLEFLEVFFATCRIGAVFVPLNFRLARDEFEFAITHCQARVLILQPEYELVAANWTSTLPDLELMAVAIPDPAGPRYPGLVTENKLGRLTGGPVVPDFYVDDQATQRIVYTSGTTARPKAALLTHGQVLAGCASRIVDCGLTRDDVSITAGPLYHVGSLDTFLTAMVYLGATTVILERFVPEDALALIERYRVTAAWMAPTMIRTLLEANEDRHLRLDSLRVLIAGGEASPPSLLDRIETALPDVGFFNGYGLTESQGIVSVLEPKDRRRRFGSVGRAALLREARIVDDRDNELPAYGVGEILVRGPLVFPGYLRDPEATAETLRDGWLHTGDVGYLDDDGYLFIVDRKKDMILSGGENIASSEVERVLDRHPAVDEVAVVGVPDERWGEVPVAFIVSRAAVSFDPDELEAFCSERLARFKVPRRFFAVEHLPRTATGKVQKSRLRASAGQ